MGNPKNGDSKRRDLEGWSTLNLIRYPKVDGRTAAAIALALGDTTSGHPQTHVHKGLEHHSVSRPGKRWLYGNAAVCVDLGVHEKVDGMDDRLLLLQAGVDVVQAVGMTCAVVIEKLIHLWTATGVKQIVLAHIVLQQPEHRAVQVGVDHIPLFKP